MSRCGRGKTWAGEGVEKCVGTLCLEIFEGEGKEEGKGGDEGRSRKGKGMCALRFVKEQGYEEWIGVSKRCFGKCLRVLEGEVNESERGARKTTDDEKRQDTEAAEEEDKKRGV